MELPQWISLIGDINGKEPLCVFLLVAAISAYAITANSRRKYKQSRLNFIFNLFLLYKNPESFQPVDVVGAGNQSNHIEDESKIPIRIIPQMSKRSKAKASDTGHASKNNEDAKQA